jgi:aarF domain-containing kinase
VFAQQQITSRELLRLQLRSNGSPISTKSVLRAALQQHSSLAARAAAAGQQATAASRFSPLSIGRQRMQLLVQQHQAQLDAVSSRWAAWEAKVITLVNSCLLAPAGQTVLGAFLPISLIAALFPNRISCRAYELPASHLYNQHYDSSSSGSAVFTPAAARIKAQHAAKQQPLATLLRQARGAISLALAQFATELAIALRGLYLAALFTPLLLTSPLVFYWGIGRPDWLQLLRWTLEKAGPAFIKWGQWGSTRPDMFPRDVCAALEALQSNAPSHAPQLSVDAVEAAFNRPLRELFSAWESQPIASGSIAQIHRARLSPQAAASCGVASGTLVAVKVRHPGVESLMAQDFVLMHRAAQAAAFLPGLKALRLEESVRQFGGPLQEQLDLSVEAQHLSKFARNFRSWRNVKFPTPIFPLVRPSVLVESFEPGAAIQGYVSASAAIASRAAVAALSDDLPAAPATATGGCSSGCSGGSCCDDAVVSCGVGP